MDTTTSTSPSSSLLLSSSSTAIRTSSSTAATTTTTTSTTRTAAAAAVAAASTTTSTTDLDDDFVNFESVSQTCTSSALDDELCLLDNEARARERGKQERGQREEEDEDEEDEEDVRNNNDPRSTGKMKGSCRSEMGVEDATEDQLFAAFAYNNSKRLTMIPVKYKMKEERRKVLKISINKLKKIDDPESWLCRSVLINNTMKKLQKEARDEKMQKQMSTYAKGYLVKSSAVGLDDADDFGCQLNNNNNNNNHEIGATAEAVMASCPLKLDDQDCFYQKDFVQKEKEDVFCQLGGVEFGKGGPATDVGKVRDPAEVVAEPEDGGSGASLSNGVPLNEDFVEKIPSIKRCASRKRSLDEDGTASEILNLDETDLEVDADDEDGLAGGGKRRPRSTSDADEVDECDVHDVLSQLYMPPTPRMLTSIDSDTDEDDLNVVDIDSSYMDDIKTECQNKLPSDHGEGIFGASRKRKVDADVDDDDEGGSSPKRKLTDDIFSCFNVCETNFLNSEKENFDNFLCDNKCKDKDRTSVSEGSLRISDKLKTCSGGGAIAEEDEFIELEDEEDIKRRLSQSLSSHHHLQQQQQQQQQQQEVCHNHNNNPNANSNSSNNVVSVNHHYQQRGKSEKGCESFFEDGCDNQYSCGHTVNMFNDIQSVTFHNLIASLET